MGEALHNLIVGLRKNFQVSISKTVGRVGFLPKAYFSLQRWSQFLAHGCQNRDIDLKFGMGGLIDTIFMWVKFGDDPISSLDFSFTGGGVPLIQLINSQTEKFQVFPDLQFLGCLQEFRLFSKSFE